MKSRYAGFFVLGIFASATAWAADARVYDIHQTESGSQRPPSAALQAKVDAFRRAIGPNGTVDFKWNTVANQLFSISFTPPLPQAEHGDAISRARAFIEGNADLFGLSHAAIESMTPTTEAREPRPVVLLEQSFGGVPFFDQQGFIRVSMTDVGIVAAAGRYAVNAPAPATTAPLNVSDAYAQLQRQLPNLWKTSYGQPSPHASQNGAPTFEADPRSATTKSEDKPARERTLVKHVGMDFTDELTARLTYFLDGPQPRLTWEFNMKGVLDRFNEPGTNSPGVAALEVLIDAQDGRVLFAHVDTGYSLPSGIASTARPTIGR